MKGLIAGIITFLIIIFLIDPMIVNWIVNLFPKSVEEWKGLIKLGTWLLVLSLTIGMSVFISAIVALIITTYFD